MNIANFCQWHKILSVPCLVHGRFVLLLMDPMIRFFKYVCVVPFGWRLKNEKKTKLWVFVDAKVSVCVCMLFCNALQDSVQTCIFMKHVTEIFFYERYSKYLTHTDVCAWKYNMKATTSSVSIIIIINANIKYSAYSLVLFLFFLYIYIHFFFCLFSCSSTFDSRILRR